MATFKGMIRPCDKRKDGTWNVKIRVTHNRETKFMSTPFYVNEDQITRGCRIKDNVILDKIDARIIELRDAVNKIGFIVDGISVDHLIRLLDKSPEKICFFDFADRHIQNLEKKNRLMTARSRRVAINSLKRFVGKNHLYFSDITADLMLSYYNRISSDLRPGTANEYMTCIKVIYKEAQVQLNDDDAGIIIAKHGVFKKIKMDHNIEYEPKALKSVADMQKVIDAPYTGSWCYDFAKDMFILSFLMFGINPKDLFFAEKSQVEDGIFHYRRSKVRNKVGKNASMQIKLNEVSKIILDKYSGDPKYLIDFQGHSRRTTGVSYIHAAFQDAGIEPHDYKVRSGHGRGEYCFYSARHSMASFARNDCGIDFITVAQMLVHSIPQSLQTTDIYIARSYEILWEANEKLYNLFDWSFYLNQRPRQEE